MNLPDSLVSYLASTCGTSEELVDLMRESTNIMSELAQLRKQHDAAHATWVSTTEALSNGITNIQARCPHRQVTYHYDPVDSSDNYEQCEVCGKTARKLKR